MTIRRFFAAPLPAPGVEFGLDAGESSHAVRVLRLRPGDEIVALDGAGTRVRAVIRGSDADGRRHAVRCEVLERETFVPPRPRLRLFVAPPRHRLMDDVVRTATELGVWRISPVRCRRSVALPPASAGHETWRRESIAAMKQSGNVFMPQIDALVPFDAALAQAGERGWFGAPADPAPAAAATEPRHAEEVALWVGPEGGFDPDEVAALRRRGFRPVTVGTWTLRVETAVPALIGWLTGQLDYDHVQCQRC